MEEHETSAGEMTRQSAVAAITSAVWFRLSVFLITKVLLLWTAWGGFKLARDSDRYTDWVFCFGILTMLFSFLLVILGLPTAAEFFLNLNLSELLQEAVGIQKGLNMMKDEGAEEAETITQVAARIFGTLVTMAMLCWTIYTGLKLTTEQKHSKYYILTTSIGALAIIFGVVYFIIILAIMAALGLHLPSLYEKAKHNNNKHHHLSGLKI